MKTWRIWGGSGAVVLVLMAVALAASDRSPEVAPARFVSPTNHPQLSAATDPRITTVLPTVEVRPNPEDARALQAEP